MKRVAALLSVILLVALAAAVAVSGPLPAHAQSTGSATFTVEETTFESNYPRGMTFTIRATSSAGEVTRATLFYVLRPGTRERANAEFDPDLGAWVARPYETGGLPPWIDFDYYWALSDSAGNTFETEPQYGIYADHTREWYHLDTEDLTLHWFGFSEGFGGMVAGAMADMRGNFAAGWGRTLSYKPIVIFFPEGDVWGEFQQGGANSRAAGFTNNGWGYSLQRLASERPPDFLLECVQRWGYPLERPLEWRLQRGASTVVHEVTHMYQSDFRVGGPAWWVEGQADYFGGLTGLDSDPNERLANLLSVTNDLPTLQGEGPALGVHTLAADSCNGLGYDMGHAFIRWLLENHGGLETHRRIVERMQTRDGLDVALEEATGFSFLELENQWRATWGLPPVAPPPTPTPFAFPTAPPMVVPTSPGGGG